MSWKQVKVEDGVIGMMKDNILNIPMIELDKNISINNKSYKIASSEIDERDNRLIVNLAIASPKKKGESEDDKQAKG
jgi:hypothetical protein